MTYIPESIARAGRVAEIRLFTSDEEDTEGVQMVYIGLHDSRLQVLANINVTRAELLAALGVEE